MYMGRKTKKWNTTLLIVYDNQLIINNKTEINNISWKINFYLGCYYKCILTNNIIHKLWISTVCFVIKKHQIIQSNLAAKK